MPVKKTTIPKPEKQREAVIFVLKTIFDPEIPFNIYDLGLIYEIAIDPKQNIAIMMTLTTPMCPVAESMPGEVQTKLKKELKWAKKVTVNLVWDPPWDMSKMAPDARLFLGF